MIGAEHAPPKRADVHTPIASVLCFDCGCIFGTESLEAGGNVAFVANCPACIDYDERPRLAPSVRPRLVHYDGGAT